MEKIIDVGGYFISTAELEFKGIRSGGPGGQHVNKVASTIQLRFDILNSSLPNDIKVKLLQSRDSRISKKGVFSIKSSNSRSQSKNKKEALSRLQEFIEHHAKPRKKRVPTRISKGVKIKRKKDKQHKSEKKSNRQRPLH